MSCGFLEEPDRGLGRDRPPISPPLYPVWGAVVSQDHATEPLPPAPSPKRRGGAEENPSSVPPPRSGEGSRGGVYSGSFSANKCPAGHHRCNRPRWPASKV